AATNRRRPASTTASISKPSGTEQRFVLDFVNEREKILERFQTYYEGAVVGDEIDPQRLYELSAELDATQIYHQAEVDSFARLFRGKLQAYVNLYAFLGQVVLEHALRCPYVN